MLGGRGYSCWLIELLKKNSGFFIIEGKFESLTSSALMIVQGQSIAGKNEM